MNMNAQISERLFYYHTMDIKQLRSKYRKLAVDLPNSLIATAKRGFVCRKLVEDELGEDNMKKYEENVMSWIEAEAFVNNNHQTKLI